MEILARYLLEAFVIAFSVKHIMGDGLTLKELVYYTVLISLTFYILKLFAPGVLSGAKQGTGFGMGSGLVGFMPQIGAGNNDEPQNGGYMDDPVAVNYYSQDRIPDTSCEGTPIMNLEDQNSTIDLYTGTNKPQKSYPQLYNQAAEIKECFMDDPAAVDYYSRDRIPTKCRQGQPIMNVNTGKHVIDLYSGAQQQQVSEPQQVDMMDRLKTDRLCLDKGLKKNDRASIHEVFQNQIQGQRVRTIEGFVDTNTFTNFKDGPGPTAGEQVLVFGTIITPPGLAHKGRLADPSPAYSGDLIRLEDKDGRVLVGYPSSNFIRAVEGEEAGALNNILFKLRFQLVSQHQESSLVPIGTGRKVHLIYTDNNGNDHKISHNGDLNTNTGNSNLGVVFEIVSPEDTETKLQVMLGSEVLLRTSEAGNLNRYLKIDLQQKRVNTDATADQATRFVLMPEKGSGPLWRFGSDTRSQPKLYNRNQVEDIVNARTQLISDDLQKLRLSNCN